MTVLSVVSYSAALAIFWSLGFRVDDVLKRFRREDPQAQIRPVAVNLAHIERQHEGQDLLAHHLPGHQDREARRIGDDEACGDNGVTRIQCFFQRAVNVEVVAFGLVIGEEEGRADIAFPGGRTGLEGVVEAAEVRQRRQVLHQALDAPVKRQALHPAGIIEAFVDGFRDLHQHFDQIGDRRARGADVGHEEDRVARGLVDLDPVFIHQDIGLERIAVPAGTAHRQRHARRVEHEIILLANNPTCRSSHAPHRNSLSRRTGGDARGSCRLRSAP